MSAPDHAQRVSACNTQESFIVQAPAGSGKTTLLIERILALLKNQENHHRILALTFTRKAAEEMQSRLQKALNTSDLPCTIATIDAWIQSQQNQKHHLHPLPQCLYQEAWNYWLHLGRESWALQRLLQCFQGSMDDLSAWIIDALERRDLWAESLSLDWREIMPRRFDEQLCAFEQELWDLEDPAWLSSLSDASPPAIGEHAAWKALAQRVLTQDGQFRKSLKHPQQTQNDRLQTLWQYLQHGDPPDMDPMDLSATQTILREVLACLKIVFDRYQASDFTESLLHMLQHLRDHHKDLPYQHLLLDEAQDTSALQWSLLETLTKNWRPPSQTLFIVGDPMQSIYRFRHAEVRMFLKILRDGWPQHPTRTLSLTANFRQSATLVHTINHVFHKAGPTHPVIEEGAMALSPSYAMRSDPGDLACLLIPKDREHALAMQQSQRPGSCGILVRTRLQGQHLALKHPELYGLELFKASDQASLRAAIHALCLCQNPMHSPSWTLLACSPWGGVPLEVWLPDCMNSHLGNWQHHPKATKFPKLTAWSQAYHALMAQNLTQTQLWLRWLGHLGILASLGSEEMAVLQRWSEHLELWQPRLGTFSPAYLNTLLEKQALSMGNPQSTHVVMTIHKAKGLEFDHVYLPYQDRQTRRPHLPALVFLPDPQGRLQLWIRSSQKERSWIADLLAQQEHHESLRLAYVAATRARESLTLSAQSLKNWARHWPDWQILDDV